jgi:hypothetical protein
MFGDSESGRGPPSFSYVDLGQPLMQLSYRPGNVRGHSAPTITSSNKDFDFLNLLMGALKVEGTEEEEDDIEKDVFEPLPCLLTGQNTPPHPPSRSTEPTRRHAIAESLMRNLVASGKSARDVRKRLRSREHKWKQRVEDPPIGGHRKTRSSTNHLCASPVKTLLQMHNLPVTKPGFIGIREKGAVRVEYSLDAMVRKHHFELKEWDGM